MLNQKIVIHIEWGRKYSKKKSLKRCTRDDKINDCNWKYQK